MKISFSVKVVVLVGICFLVSNAALAQEKVLTTSEITQLFSDATFNVTEMEPDQDTGKTSAYTVHTSADGVASINSNDSRLEPRIWSVSEDGRFCFTRRSIYSASGKNCGYLVDAGGGVVNMYRIEGDYYPGRKIVGGNRSKHIFSFSDFK